MRLLEVNLNTMSEETEVHQYLKEQMNFPEHYGANLDALYDVLTELEENICVEIVRCTDEHSALYEFGKKLESVMEDAAQTVQYSKDGKVYAIFAGVEPLAQSSMW